MTSCAAWTARDSSSEVRTRSPRRSPRRSGEGPTVEGVPALADLEGAIDDLFGNQRARRVLAQTRPDAARIATFLDEAEAILVDRLGDEG